MHIQTMAQCRGYAAAQPMFYSYLPLQIHVIATEYVIVYCIICYWIYM